MKEQPFLNLFVNICKHKQDDKNEEGGTDDQQRGSDDFRVVCVHRLGNRLPDHLQSTLL